MNRRGFLILRIFIEVMLAIGLLVATVDVERVPLSSHVWIDLPCRLLFAGLSMVLLVDSVRLQKEVRAR